MHFSNIFLILIFESVFIITRSFGSGCPFIFQKNVAITKSYDSRIRQTFVTYTLERKWCERKCDWMGSNCIGYATKEGKDLCILYHQIPKNLKNGKYGLWIRDCNTTSTTKSVMHTTVIHSTTAPVLATTTSHNGDNSSCCMPLKFDTFDNQTIYPYGLSQISYPDSKNTCLTMAKLKCSNNLSEKKAAGIRMNRFYYMNVGYQNVTFEAKCMNGTWHAGEPPLLIERMECILASLSDFGLADPDATTNSIKSTTVTRPTALNPPIRNVTAPPAPMNYTSNYWTCCNVIKFAEFYDQTIFMYGKANVTYDKNTCRTSALLTCSVKSSNDDREVGIIANRALYLAASHKLVEYQLSCINSSWFAKLVHVKIENVECVMATDGNDTTHSDIKPNVLENFVILSNSTNVMKNSFECCDELKFSKFPGQTRFEYGEANILYDDESCKSEAYLNCSNPNTIFEMEALIRANHLYMTTSSYQRLEYQAECINGTWYVGEPSLSIEIIECILAYLHPEDAAKKQKFRT